VNEILVQVDKKHQVVATKKPDLPENLVMAMLGLQALPKSKILLLLYPGD